MQIDRKRIALVLGLLVAGYAAGIATPTAQAYSQDETHLMNRVVAELQGIRRSLDVIARKLK